MTIIHVVESYGGGVIDFIYHLTNELHEYKHIVIYSQRKDSIGLNFPSNTTFIHWPFIKKKINVYYDVRAFIELIKLLNSTQYDVIHLHSSKAGFLGRIAIPFLKRGDKTKLIYTPNGAPFNQLSKPKYVRSFYIFLEKVATSFGGSTVCSSKSEGKDYKKIGINCTYINNGIKPIKTSPKKFDQLQITILTVGRITEQKNPALFNSIAEEFLDKNIKFIWIGDGELRSELKSKNIEITGWKSKSEVLKLMESGHIYLSTSLWEGLPFSILDAMNFKYPLLLKNCTGNVDLVRNGENGFIFESADEATKHIEKFLEDRKSITKMGVASYDILSKNFDAEMMAQKYEWAYSDQLDRLNRV